MEPYPARILLPDLLRRVAVRTVVFAIAMAMIVPLSARSASPVPPETQHLLDVAVNGPLPTLDRGLAGRAASAALSLQEVSAPVTVEQLVPVPYPTPGPAPATVTYGVVVTARPVVRVVPPPTGGATVTGRATWYCCTSGWRGVAVVALPGALGGHFDAPPASRFVTVCADRCVRLPVADYCGCYWGTADQRVADLSPEAWAAVTDKSRTAGVVTVTIHL
jgi:hypothetical protein